MVNRNNNISIQKIKEEIEKLKGQKINMSVNQGRKKYVNLQGVIQDTYNSIFVVKLIDSNEKNCCGELTSQKNAIESLQEVIESKATQYVNIENVEVKNNNVNNNRREPEEKNDLYDYPPILDCKKTQSIDTRTYSYIDILCGNVDIDGFLSK